MTYHLPAKRPGYDTRNTLHFVNLWQTNDERKQKYWFCKSLGLNPSWARALRDWPIVKIERFFNLKEAPMLIEDVTIA